MSRPPERIDVCIPTWNSGQVVEESLRRLSTSLENSTATLNTLVVVDNVSEDDTVETIQSYANTEGWETDVTIVKKNLPEARQLAIRKSSADWLLFLDDDVRLSPDYIQRQLDCVAPQIGAVQGRKRSNTEEPWEWVRRRVNRGGTHATLVRKSALEGLDIPSDLVVFEDEYIRRQIESNGYLWIFNHQAQFEHDSMERHGIDWEQGYLTGKYGLMPGYVVLLAIGEGFVSDKPLGPRLLRLAGWTAGRVRRRVSGIE